MCERTFSKISCCSGFRVTMSGSKRDRKGSESEFCVRGRAAARSISAPYSRKWLPRAVRRVLMSCKDACGVEGRQGRTAVPKTRGTVERERACSTLETHASLTTTAS